MAWYQHFFLDGPIPAHVMHGSFNIKLVFLSYVIASVTSYVALDMSSHLKKQNSTLFRIGWWSGGALIMGAGIWSMHFVGMLAFDMNMAMTYDLFWTGLSMLVAVLTAWMAFLFFMVKQPKTIHYVLSGILLGSSIPLMHYTGMAGMNDVIIKYKVGLFLLSILVAIVAATAALWFSVHGDQGSYSRRVRFKIISALIMGVGISGMHYVGIAAAVFIPNAEIISNEVVVEPTIMAVLIASIVLSIMFVALILSTTKYYVTTKLQNEKDFLEVVLNSLDGGVIAFDENQKIKLYNLAIQQLFSNFDIFEYFSSSNSNNKELALLRVDNKRPLKPDEYPLERIFRGEKVKNMEALIQNKQGKELILSIDGQLLLEQDDKPVGAVVVFQDITKRKEIEQMKNEFISTVSHELRTPLTSINGSLALIKCGTMGNVSEEMSSLLDIACNNSERLVRLINDILDTEKIESGKMLFHFSKVSLSKVIEQALQANKSYADKYQVTYKIKHLIRDAQVRIDADRISQVLDNLLSNAAKFSKPGSTIEISMQREEGSIIVAVTDSGVGIPETAQDKIFSKFYQVDSSTVRKKGGTGLGLSICKSIVESHNGKIWFESTPDIGTTFYFNLVELKHENMHKIEAVEKNRSNKDILICEDDPDISKLLGLMLKERGFSSVRVATITEAKQVLKQQYFCFMTLDLLLPDGNGLDLLKWIRTQPNIGQLPVAIISAVSAEQEKIKGLALGVIDWINKPIDENRLYNDIIQTLGINNLPNKFKVLHIEDDLSIAQAVHNTINSICEIDVSKTAEHAKKMLRDTSYDLLILDMNLSDGSSSDLLTHIEKNNYQMPVIILSDETADINLSKNIIVSLIKSTVNYTDLMDKIVSIIKNNDHKSK